MSRLVAWFASNRVAANLLMIFIVVAGVASVDSIRQEVFPNVAFDMVSISVPYPGAAPDEVEESICIPIEEAIHDVKGVDRVYALASEGFAGVWVELEVDADPRRVLERIQTRVDSLDTLPEDAEKPLVQELIDDHVLLSVFVSGAADELALRSVAERVRDEMTDLPQVHRAELVGVPPYQIAIEVSEAALRRHGLRFDDVTRAVRASSLDLPGGSLKTRSGEILVRAQAQAQRGREFETIVLMTRSDGTRLLLGDVARVVDAFEESDETVRLDGERAAVVRVLSSERENVLEISRAVHEYVASARSGLPEGVELAIWTDDSQEFQSRRDLMLRSGAQGLVLILFILALFLRFQLAIWVALGIPISFLGALVAMWLADVSINMMSLFAFIMALGLVVDDAIIVGESVAREQGGGETPLRGSIAGALQVALPVTIAVLTTLFFLAPALALPTVIGKVSRDLAVVAMACLAFSLIESLLILPAHLSMRFRARPPSTRRARGSFAMLQRRVEEGLERFVERVYRPSLDWALRWPVLTLSLAVAALMLAVGGMAGGWVRDAFLPDMEDVVVSATLVLPEGTPPDAVDAAVLRIEGAADALAQELMGEEGGIPVVLHRMAAIGDPPDRHNDLQDGGDGPNVAHLRLELVPSEERRVSSDEVANRWRERVGAIPGALALDFSGSDFGFGPPIDVALYSEDRAALRRAADALKQSLAGRPGVRDVKDSMRDGKQELKLRIRPEAEAMGLSLAELVRQVRQGFHGEEVQRLQRGRDEVEVVVRYPPEERRSLADLESVWIRLPDGGELPFSAVAEATISRGYSAIERRDRKASVRVTASVDKTVTTPSAVLAELEGSTLGAILADHPGVSYALDGASRQEQVMQARLFRDWTLALLAAYALMAVALRSYLQPLLILGAVPFGFVGAVLAHFLLGLEFSAFSLIGLVALTGVVINDALVLVDRANRKRGEGLDVSDALREAGATRFRPILLTSLTTFFGLLPLLFERSAQAAWLKPMAATLGFGVLCATVITLLLVPATYLALERGIALAQALPGRDRCEAPSASHRKAAA